MVNQLALFMAVTFLTLQCAGQVGEHSVVGGKSVAGWYY